jgi:hypothetical protein
MRRTITILAVAIILLAPTVGRCDLVPYLQDFEMLEQSNPEALAMDGWLVFANVFAPDGSFLYNYGPFPAPNGGPGFCGIDIGQGGPEQGEQQLVVYNDYNNPDHNVGNLIEANVFQEQIIGMMDVGTTWLFQFDAKRGNIEPNSTATAFFKTIDPNNGFALTNFITVDMTDVMDTWSSRLLTIYIDEGLEGQLLQFGFLTVAANFQGSGVFYDNLRFVSLDDQCTPDDEFDDEGDDDEEYEIENVYDKDPTLFPHSSQKVTFGPGR